MRKEKELQKRFGVTSGRFFDIYRYKNLNWYIGKQTSLSNPLGNTGWIGTWFCYGDVTNDDIRRIHPLLNDDEMLLLGWKDLSPRQGDFEPPLYQYNKCWLRIIKEGVEYDHREGSLPGHAFTIDTDGVITWEQFR